MVHPKPSIAVAYICVSQGQNSPVYAQRFLETYRKHPAGYDHEPIAVLNGGPPGDWLKHTLQGSGFRLFPRDNAGWDIGGFIHLARESHSDCLMCFGETVYFHRAGWLERIAQAWSECGPGMYGCFASNLVRPHLNTTAFACDRNLLATHPHPVISKQDRYAFEHGPKAFWIQVHEAGYPVRLVTWDGIYLWPKWRSAENILWKGDQSNCLVFCHHTLKYMLAGPVTKKKWETGADIGKIPASTRQTA